MIPSAAKLSGMELNTVRVIIADFRRVKLEKHVPQLMTTIPLLLLNQLPQHTLQIWLH